LTKDAAWHDMAVREPGEGGSIVCGGVRQNNSIRLKTYIDIGAE